MCVDWNNFLFNILDFSQCDNQNKIVPCMYVCMYDPPISPVLIFAKLGFEIKNFINASSNRRVCTTREMLARFQVNTTAVLKTQTFFRMTPCRLVNIYRPFEGSD